MIPVPRGISNVQYFLISLHSEDYCGGQCLAFLFSYLFFFLLVLKFTENLISSLGGEDTKGEHKYMEQGPTRRLFFQYQEGSGGALKKVR